MTLLVSEEQSGKKKNIQTLEMEFIRLPITNCYQKTRTKVTTPAAKRSSELHDPLNHLHRTNREGAHKPVGDILKTESWEGALIWSSTSLQNILDCTVPPELQEKTAPLTSCLNLGWLAILISWNPIQVTEQQKLHGDLEQINQKTHDENTPYTTGISWGLWMSWVTDRFDLQSQRCIPKGHEFPKSRTMNQGTIDLGNKVRKNGKGAWSHPKEKQRSPCCTLTLLANAKAKRNKPPKPGVDQRTTSKAHTEAEENYW